MKSNKDREWNYQYDAEGDRIHEEKIVLNRYSVDYEKDSDEWYDYVQTLPFEEVKQLLAEKDSKETFDALRYQLNYRKQKGLCVSNLVKDADIEKEECTHIDYTLDKTVEDALILSSGNDFNIYGEERIATESEEILTYIGSLNQSVMQTVKDDLNKDNPKQILSSLEYDDAGNTLDINSGFGYNGEKLDETGNIYLRARYYNPRIGQFVQIDSNRGKQSNISSQQRYTYVANNQYKYVDTNGNFFLVLGLILGSYAVGGAMAYKQYQNIEKINKQRKQEQFEKTVGKNFDQNVQDVINGTKGLDEVIPSQKIVKNYEKTVKKDTIDIIVKNDIHKSISKNKGKPIKEVEPCIYKDMTLLNQYQTIYSKIFNSVKDGKSVAKKAINFNYFTGEARTMLSYALTLLDNARGYAVNEKQSGLNLVISQISNFAKASYYLGQEFKKEVTLLANKMYKNITSNVSPYRETSYWTSAYGDITCHLHKDSEAYQFLGGEFYKKSIEFGKATNVVMPIVGDILTGYIVYQKYFKTNVNPKNPVNGENWYKYFKKKYGVSNVTWESKWNTYSVSLNELPQSVQDTYRGYSHNGWKGNYSGQASSVYGKPKAGRSWMNEDNQLPTLTNGGTKIIYREFDVNPPGPKGRDASRFLYGSDGSIYYTTDHYETFLKVR